MEELNFERQFLVSPQRVLRLETYLPVTVVVEVLQIIGQFGLWRFVRLTRRIARELPNNRSIERDRFRER
jgi:hypothetical protein